MVILLLLAFLTSVGILFYYVTHPQDITSVVQKSVEEELKKYHINTDNLSLDESKIVLAVAQYCAADPNNCRGPQGDTGATGLQGLKGDSGTIGANGKDAVNGENGTNGADGKDGAEGTQGPPGEKGEPGPKTERRCNAEERRMEWRNEGDENWQVEYYLSPLQSCP